MNLPGEEISHSYSKCFQSGKLGISMASQTSVTQLYFEVVTLID